MRNHPAPTVTKSQPTVDATAAALGRVNGEAAGHDRHVCGGAHAAAEGLDSHDRSDRSAREQEGVQDASVGLGGGVDDDVQAIADAPPAGYHQVRLLRVTLVHRSGDHGYELLLQSGAHLWRPRPLWFRADRVPPAIVRRDLSLLVSLLHAVAAPGALTEAEAAEALAGLEFVVKVDASGAVTMVETPI